MPWLFENASAFRMFMPKLESVPATDANRKGRSPVTSVTRQAASTFSSATATPRCRNTSPNFTCASISSAVCVRAYRVGSPTRNARFSGGPDGGLAMRSVSSSPRQFAVSQQVELPQHLGAPRSHGGRIHRADIGISHQGERLKPSRRYPPGWSCDARWPDPADRASSSRPTSPGADGSGISRDSRSGRGMPMRSRAGAAARTDASACPPSAPPFPTS